MGHELRLGANRPELFLATTREIWTAQPDQAKENAKRLQGARALQPFLETMPTRHEPDCQAGANLPQVLQLCFVNRCFDPRLLSTIECLLVVVSSAGAAKT
uniref:Uncharacterized protein n=1 Tax=Geobacter metallireducens TaxID=28232 RepID=A0A831TYG9_GEOME